MTDAVLASRSGDNAVLHRLEAGLRTVNPTGASWELREVLRHVSPHKKLLDLFTGDKTLTPAEVDHAERLVSQRLEGRPLAHLTGEAVFCDFILKVTGETLIPRPETELLVEEAALRCIAAARPVRFLDLGCGTGCITIGVLKRAPLAEAVAIEIALAAARCAAANFEMLGVADRVRLIRGDYTRGAVANGAAYDMILANPPYVSEAEYAGLDAEVKREPYVALVGGVRGDEVARRIIEMSAGWLVRGGTLLMEVGLGQAAPLAALAPVHGLRHVKTLPDHQGIDRIVVLEKI